MKTALDRMLARLGKDRGDLPKRGTLGKILKANGVQRTPELERVVNIPRRVYTDEEKAELQDLLTEGLKLPGGTMRLNPIQATALADLHDFGGLFAPIRVGGGKTLISMLAPIVLDAKRPLLLVPAKLIEKTWREFGKLAAHWPLHPFFQIESYERIGRVHGNEILAAIAPDLLILDECQKVKNPRAAVTRRVARWMKENPETRMAALSGTITQRSLKDFAHIVAWCLPKHAPIPLRYNELVDWSLAIDEKLPAGQERRQAGALSQLYNEEEEALELTDPVSAVRRAYGRRLHETPGVVATTDPHVGSSLSVEAIEYTPGPEASSALDILRAEFTLPDGQEVISPMDVWRHARELALGFFYRWDPPAPEEWREARRRWGKAVRYVLANNRRQLDSELPVANACARGEYDSSYILEGGVRVFEETIGDIWRAWAEIRPTFEINTVPVWLDDAALKIAAEWAAKNGGIVWVEHVAFGQRLSELTGMPYFAQRGLDATGRMIEDADPADGPVIASVASNAEGRNLQAWNRSLVVSPSASGALWEQLLGRMHRQGQEADEVIYEVLLGSIEQSNALAQALDDARYIQDMTGQAQKLLYADLVIPGADAIGQRGGSSTTETTRGTEK